MLDNTGKKEEQAAESPHYLNMYWNKLYFAMEMC